MIKIIKILLPVFLIIGLGAQGLFESATSTEKNNEKTGGLAITGFVRSIVYINETPDQNEKQLQSGYGETCLILQAERGDWGDAFAELRFRSGHEYGNDISEFDVREVYVNVYWWEFDFRLGKQIVMWGRADGFNPTNNITPQDPTVRSPDPDDIHGANFLLRTHLNLTSAWRLEGIWVPRYSPTVLAFEMADLPDYITIGAGENPDARLKNSLWAGRLSLEFPAFDGSISYVEGYNPTQGITWVNPESSGPTIILAPIAYRRQVFGLDFSTAVGSWGLRGEVVYRVPDKEHNVNPNYYIPFSDLYFVTGVDRSWGDFSLITQYIGRYIVDYEDVFPGNYLDNYNRLFSNQTHSARHAITFRPAITLFYETLNLELFSLYDLTTDEYMVMPKISYSPADAIKLIVGANYYQGDEGTAFDLIENSFNAVFMELKLSF